ncbi:hypothetical protein GCM10023116_04010 [Kistimonas scapharcae]|uniref:Uncharacterized protein n=1 Tax=Kistimonas scapharcae TaxID=1036133 RepID=A0ABP8V001_9GAMM
MDNEPVFKKGDLVKLSTKGKGYLKRCGMFAYAGHFHIRDMDANAWHYYVINQYDPKLCFWLSYDHIEHISPQKETATVSPTTDADLTQEEPQPELCPQAHDPKEYCGDKAMDVVRLLCKGH